MVDVETLAKQMFMRQAATYNADPAMIELAWVDPEIRGFWHDEAVAVLTMLGEM